jgi:hypothetical protein
VIPATAAGGIIALVTYCAANCRGTALEGGAMTDHELTAREDRLVGICLTAVAIIVVLVFILSTP